MPTRRASNEMFAIGNGDMRARSSARVAIIILSWNRFDELFACLTSVLSLRYPEASIVVVDNASSDDSAMRVAATFPHVTLIRNAINMGYAGGNNVGIRHALQAGAEYVWLLNNDVELLPDTLTNLVAALESDARVGLVSPVIRFFDDRDRVQFEGQELDWSSFRLVKSGCRAGPGSIPILTGAALLVRRRVFESIGLLDEGFFAYWEDTDLCVRANRAGFNAKVVAGALAFHKTLLPQANQVTRPPHFFYYMTRNSYFFWGRHSPEGFTLVLARKLMADAIGDAAVCRRRNDAAAANACLDGAWSALKNVKGAYDQRTQMPAWVRRILEWHPYFWVSLLDGRLLKELSGRMRRRLFRRQPGK